MTPDPSLTKLYRDLLNHVPGLDANALTTKLSEDGVITDAEKSVVDDEKNFSLRQYVG